MNCQVVQNKLLMLPDPRVIPDGLREHMAGCAACQSWSKQAARLEALIEQLPTPLAPADKKDALIGTLVRGGDIIIRPATPVPPRESRGLVFLRRNATMIGGLAAVLLVALGVWAFLPRTTRPETVQTMPDDPFLRKIVQHDLAMAKASSPAERLQVLSGLADDLSVQARALARVASPDELRDIARWYDKVVKGAMIKQAEFVPAFTMTPAERDARQAMLQSLMDRLNAAATETETLSNEVSPEVKRVLQRMTESARESRTKLQEEQIKIRQVELQTEGKK